MQRAVAGSLFAKHWVFRIGSTPAKIENRIAGWANVLGGIAMAIKAPFHLQRCMRVRQRHLIDRSMARSAANPFVDMNLVVEVNKVRKIVQLGPPDWRAIAVACANWL